ncbi:MAG: 3'-5' exonuclease [Bacillota bacterium]|nr:3'-5' exonuclease [Bacillota bacterium]
MARRRRKRQLLQADEARKLAAVVHERQAGELRRLAAALEAVVVFDLEWNMAEPWRPVPPEIQARLPYEIIDIGAVRLELPRSHTRETLPPLDLEHAREFTETVRPVVHKRLNRYVARVTGRDRESLRFGRTFPRVYTDFHAFCGPAPWIYATWSASDSGPLAANLAWHDMGGELGVRVLDVQRVFAQLTTDTQSQRSIQAALGLLGLEENGARFHTAIVDAHLTAVILLTLLRRALGLEPAEAPPPEEPAEGEEAPPARVDVLPWSGSFEDFLRRFTMNPDLNTRGNLAAALSGSQAEVIRRILALELRCPACGEILQGIEPRLRTTATASRPAPRLEKTPPEPAEQVSSGDGGGEAEAAEKEKEEESWPPVIGPWARTGKRYGARFLCPEHAYVEGRFKLRRRSCNLMQLTGRLTLEQT